MAQYLCECVDKSGKHVSQKLEGGSEGEIRMLLRGMNLRPVRIRKAKAAEVDLFTLLKIGGNRVPQAELVIFTRQMQVLINAGIPLMQSLEILTDQALPGALRNVLIGMKERVSRGGYLWEAMQAYPNAFSKLYVALIRAGESSGSLDQILKRLSRYLEDSDRLRKQVKGAMMYPIIVIVIGISVVGLMLAFVIPKFEEMLRQGGQELPLPTKVVISSSHFLTANWHFVLGGIVGAFVLLSRYVKTDEGQHMMDRLIFKVPLFGALALKSGVARFSRTLQTLLSSGVNLIDAIEICKSTIGNVVLEDATKDIKKAVEGGQALGVAITKSAVFPRMSAQMIQVGESTGNLDKMLEKIADFYEADVEALVSGLSRLIEPLVLVFLGGTVGGILISMYLPIFSLAGGQS